MSECRLFRSPLPLPDRRHGQVEFDDNDSRLVMFAPREITVEIGEDGEPALHVGHPDRGTTVTVTTHGVDLWAMGNVVASLDAPSTD